MVNVRVEIFCKISGFTHSSTLESIYLFHISLSTKRNTEGSPSVTAIGFQTCYTVLSVDPHVSMHAFLFSYSLMKSEAKKKRLLWPQTRTSVWGDTHFVHLWHKETVNMSLGAVNTFRRQINLQVKVCD